MSHSEGGLAVSLLRVPIIQLVALNVAMIVSSFLPIPLLGGVLAEVRLLLVMVLGVVLIYTGVLRGRGELKPQPVVVYEPWADEALIAIERGY